MDRKVLFVPLFECKIEPNRFPDRYCIFKLLNFIQITSKISSDSAYQQKESDWEKKYFCIRYQNYRAVMNCVYESLEIFICKGLSVALTGSCS